MKSFSPTWQQIALVFVLLAAIIVTHVIAAPAVGAVTSIVSTLVGAFFIDLRRDQKQAPDDTTKGGAS